jgi:N-acetylglucosamine-6-sulfatase
MRLPIGIALAVVSARPRLFALLALGLAALGAGLLVVTGDTGGRTPESVPPNVVVVMTDDQDVRSIEAMPRVTRLIGERGATFSDAIASYPLCCPSRVTFLTGQYAHNHGAKGNFPDTDGGGYVSLVKPRRTLPAWLNAAGYRTGHVGKWPTAPGPADPPGWDLWMTTTEETAARYYDYMLHDGGGGVLRFGWRRHDYHTDVVTRLATELVRRWAPRPEPFFLSIAYLAPHVGLGAPGEPASRRCGGTPADDVEPDAPVPAPRHADAFTSEPLPQPPSFNEQDISDKPRIPVPGQAFPDRRLRRDEVEELRRMHGCRLASLKAVDQGVGRLVRALRSAGVLEDTVVVFTSDNGYLLGEHRITGRKNIPYEEALRVPLLVSGPGIPVGAETNGLAVNADLAPTILDLIGVEPARRLTRPADGRSLTPLLRGEVNWPDRAVPVEGRSDTRSDGAGGFQVASYVGIRTERYAYLEHHLARVESREAGAAVQLGAGERVAVQLYDLEQDPYQLDSRHADPRYKAVRGRLAELLSSLVDCVGESCQVEEPLPAPG